MHARACGRRPAHARRLGLEVVRALQQHRRRRRSIVVLTGYGSIATALDAVRLGATHYLTKPADADEIVAAFARERPRAGAAARRGGRRRRSPASSGSTSTACSPTAAATSRRPRGGSASTAARCSASCRSTRCRAERPSGRPSSATALHAMISAPPPSPGPGDDGSLPSWPPPPDTRRPLRAQVVAAPMRGDQAAAPGRPRFAQDTSRGASGRAWSQTTTSAPRRRRSAGAPRAPPLVHASPRRERAPAVE